MDSKSIHGEVKARIYRNILLKRVFTVSELCEDTGLRPEQAYPVLAKLRKSGFLLKEPVAEQNKPPHRPNVLYKLSGDVEKRKVLTSEISPFLRLNEESLSRSPALEEAQRRMGDFSDRFEAILRQFASGELDIAQLEPLLGLSKELQLGLTTLKDDLEIAWYECNRVEGSLLGSEVRSELRRFRRLSQQAAELDSKLETQVHELNGQREFSELAARSFDLSKGLDIGTVLSLIEREYRQSGNFYVKRALSSLAARARFAASHDSSSIPSPSARLACALAESSLRFGSNPQLCHEWVNHISRSLGSGSVIAKYNVANSNLLVNALSIAFETWKEVVRSESRQELVANFGGTKHLKIYRGAKVITGDIESLRRSHLVDLEDRLGPEGAFSLVSTLNVDAFGGAPYIVKPTLLDWLEPNSPGFVLADAIRRKQTEIFAYGPLADIVQFPGLPAIRLATALARLGVNLDISWRVAETLKANKILLVLHTLSLVSGSTLSNLTDVLPANFSVVPEPSAAAYAA